MKKFISPGARDDILRQYRYLLLDAESPVAAERFLRAVQAGIKWVCKQPRLGAPTNLNNPQLAGLRSWPVEGFPSIRIYYLISQDSVRVVRVLHGKRDIRSILEDESIEP